MIYGKVFRYFEVKNIEFNEAINSLCRPHLFKIIVEDAEIGEKILKHRLIKGRTSLLPLANLRIRGFSNFIQSRQTQNNIRQVPPDNMVLSEALNVVKSVKGARVYLPRQLINFNPKFGKIIDFVFQNCLVVSCMEAGRVVCDRLKIPCVTISGEMVSEGVLSGGFSENKFNALEQAKQFINIEERLNKLDFEIETEEKEKVKLKSIRQKMDQVQKELRSLKDLKEGFEKNRKEVIKSMEIISDENLMREVDELERIIEKSKAEQKEKEEKLHNLRQQVKNASDKKRIEDSGGIILDVISELKQLEKEEDIETGKQIKAEELIKTNKREKIFLEKKLNKINGDLLSEKMHLKNYEEERNILEKEVQILFEKVNKLNENFEEINRRRRFLGEQRKLLEIEVTSKIEEEREIKSKIREMETEARRLAKDVEEISKENMDIQEENDNKLEQSMQLLVNVSSNDSQQDLFQKLERMEKKASELNYKIKKLRRVVQFESEDLLNKLEKDVEFIGKHKGIVRGDLRNIKQNIEGLNRKKKFAVIKCFQKVNTNLQQIFSALVPGAIAKMVLKDYTFENENLIPINENALQSKFIKFIEILKNS